jgi:hypothetical protein
MLQFQFVILLRILAIAAGVASINRSKVSYNNKWPAVRVGNGYEEVRSSVSLPAKGLFPEANGTGRNENRYDTLRLAAA